MARTVGQARKACSSGCLQGVYGPAITFVRFTLAAVFLILASLEASAGAIAGRAIVISGDTLEIDGQLVRIIDIDAPELGQHCFKSLDESWPCGEQAALQLSSWLGEQIVTCEATKEEISGLRRYWLARCSVSGHDIAEWLAANGWAVPDRRRRCDQIRDAAHKARAAQLGLWTSAFTMPWDWREAR